MIEAHPATKWREDGTVVVATKWRHDVAMGVSPWSENLHHAVSPEGTTGNPTRRIHAAPSGLCNRVGTHIHGFAPVATTCRPSGTNVLTPGPIPATKWRHAVAMGVSPWNRIALRDVSPEGTAGNPKGPTHAGPSGLCNRVGTHIYGFAPVATACRPFGTNVFTPGRTACAEKVEDDGVPLAEKMEGLTRELATQLYESEKRMPVAFG